MILKIVKTMLDGKISGGPNLYNVKPTKGMIVPLLPLNTKRIPHPSPGHTKWKNLHVVIFRRKEQRDNVIR